jgi:hypothetical protein
MNSNASLATQRRRRRYIDGCFIVYLDTFIDEDNFSLFSRCECSIESFTDPNECIHFIRGLEDQKVFCIISSELAERILPLLHVSPVVTGIYIICTNHAEQNLSINNYPKVRARLTDLSHIIEAIKEEIQVSYRNCTPLTVLSPTQQPHSRNTTFMYCQLLKEAFLGMDYGTEAKRVSADLCRRELADNQAALRVINEFERDYEQHCPAWWFTRDCFVRHLLNDALRTQDIEVLHAFGFFINDLHRQLEELHQALPCTRVTVYRGQG